MTTLAEFNTLTWRTEACPTTFCLQPAGRRCIDRDGNRVPPHPARRDALALSLLGQVAELQQGIEQRDVIISGHAEALRTAAENAQALTDQLRLARLGAALVPGLQQQVVDLLAKVAELSKPVVEPDPTPDPAPDPQKPGRLPFGIGLNEKPTGNATPLPFTLTQIEAEAGVKFAYAHEYFSYPSTGVATSAVSWAKAQLAAGRIPVVSIKVPGNDWKAAAAGKIDAVVKATSDALAALVTDPARQRVIVGLQGEPDNDGKPWADFAALVRRLLPLAKRPGRVELWLCMTGWEQLYGGDSEWDLEDIYIEGVDGYGFDPYLSLGASSAKLTDLVKAYAVPYGKWAASHGVQWGYWETGMGENAARVTTIPGVKTQLVDSAAGVQANGGTMWIYWNNRRPLRSGETQADVQDWRITRTAPANKLGQLVTAMRRWAWTKAA